MTNFAIIVSNKDKAGMNIKSNLLQYYNFKKTNECYELGNIKLYEVSDDSIYCENIDKKVKADYLIFATKHKSAAKKPSLSVHVPGNWSKAHYGGKDYTLCTAPASLLKTMFIELNKNAEGLSDYDITLEAVHHGPYVEKPVMFIEIGSTETQWNDAKAGKVIANTIMNVLKNNIKRYKTVIAFGSTHYPAQFNKFLLRTDYAIGQICPKYMVDNLTKDLVLQAFNKNVEQVEFALLDWKGLGKGKQKLLKILQELNIDYKNVQKFI